MKIEHEHLTGRGDVEWDDRSNPDSDRKYNEEEVDADNAAKLSNNSLHSHYTDTSLSDGNPLPPPTLCFPELPTLSFIMGLSVTRQTRAIRRPEVCLTPF